ncbi:hypothetical protein [Actinomadura opuntiae]|uniref:hypothetical protein n=1 Tax=Actinomadura sp. OS1-43 TaxID=604315 RepID=UPI00255B06D6|nr:hypothetical protein [Actinomadura sp. OS1-43]MDL4813116.1 hypothetical protein [Actinomadura sp. OS1-43]
MVTATAYRDGRPDGHQGLCPADAADGYAAWAAELGGPAQAWAAARRRAAELLALDRQEAVRRRRRPGRQAPPEHLAQVAALTALAVHHAAWLTGVPPRAVGPIDPLAEISPTDASPTDPFGGISSPVWRLADLSLGTLPAALADVLGTEHRHLRQVLLDEQDPHPVGALWGWWRVVVHRVLNGLERVQDPVVVTEPPPGTIEHEAWSRAFALADAYPLGDQTDPNRIDTFAGAQVVALLLAVQAHEQQRRPGDVPLDGIAFLLDLPASARLEHYLEIMGASRYLPALHAIRSRRPAQCRAEHDLPYGQVAARRNARSDALDIVSAGILAQRGGVQLGDHVTVLDQQFQDVHGPAGSWEGTVTGAQIQFPGRSQDTTTDARFLLYVRPDHSGPETIASEIDVVVHPTQDPRRAATSLHRTAHVRLETVKHSSHYLTAGMPRYLQRLQTLRHEHADAIIELLTRLLPGPAATPAHHNDAGDDEADAVAPEQITEIQLALDQLLDQ